MSIKQILKKENLSKLYDLLMSVGSIVVFNMVIQLFIYPFIAGKLGNEGFGQVRSMMALITITSCTLGVAANYSRMMTEKKYSPANSNYVYILLGGSLVCIAIGIVYMYGLGVFSVVGAILFAILITLTAFRYYSDVDFKLKTDFFGYMIFYVAIAAGYAAGILVYMLTDQWFFAFIVGEAVGILFVILRGSIYKKAFAKPDASLPGVAKSMSYLLSSTLMENLTLNADGLVLVAFCGDEAVAIFYVASLLGKVIAMLSTPLNSLIISYLVKSNIKLNGKFWTIASSVVAVLGVLAFAACRIASPIYINIFYPLLSEATLPILSAAILGQIFYFISGILLIVLLKFNGEKNQFIMNAAYCAEYFILVTVFTATDGLAGFVWGTLIANAIRFFGVIALGFISAFRAPKKEAD